MLFHSVDEEWQAYRTLKSGQVSTGSTRAKRCGALR
jgi:hypothetical protein